MPVRYSKLVPALALVGAVIACTKEEESGACVAKDGDATYCLTETSGVCDGSQDVFTPGASCPSVGFTYFCTEADMKASGSKTVYGVDRYLNNKQCDPTAGAGTGGGGDAGAQGAAYVQFYADPAKFSRSAGYVISGIEAEGRTYVPEATKGTCAQQISFKGSVIGQFPSPRVAFKIHAQNYSSLDTAFGAPYTNEEGNAIYYISDFKPGCNTLSVTGASNNITLGLSQ